MTYQLTANRSPLSPEVRLTDSSELLSIIPHLIGYHPTDSVVVVCVDGQGRITVTARFDVDDGLGANEARRLASSVAGQAGAVFSTTGLVVAYSDAALCTGTPTHRAVRAAQRALEGVGCRAEGWWVSSLRYGCLDCDDVTCCPPGGRPVLELESTPAAAQMVLIGSAPASRLDDLARIDAAPKERRALARRAAKRLRTTGRQREDWLAEAFAGWLTAVRRAEMGCEQPAAALGRLGEALSSSRMRDLLLLWFAPGGEALARKASLMGVEAASDEATLAMAALVDGSGPGGPDRGRLEAAVCVLEAVVAHSNEARSAEPMAILAFLAWWFGNGAKARLRAQAALRANPECRIANIVENVCAAGLPPAWARKP